MLHRELINPKTYDERYTEALAQIPVYSKEWTNYNMSDPGITILESLAIFETLHQERINEMPVEVKEQLLKMAGFVAQKAHPSRLLLKPIGVTEPYDIPQGQTFLLGNIHYEAIRGIHDEACRVMAVYCESDDNYTQIPLDLIRNSEFDIKVFGDNPKPGDALYIVCDKLPPAGEEIFMYASCDDKNRNPFDAKTMDLFADVVWEVYTANGFIEMESKDSTAAFLVSGEIKLRMPNDEEVAVFDKTPIPGYVIRARLTKADYDRPPHISNFEGFLIEVWQRNTRAFSKASKSGTKIVVRKDLIFDKYVTIFAKEEKGQSYRKYSQAMGEVGNGRYYDVIETDSEVIYSFDKAKYGFGPEKGRDSIRLIAYDEATMRNFQLGKCYGFDNQIVELPFENIAIESFSMILEREIDGELVYDFVRPNHSKDGEFEYSLMARDGKVCIIDAGDYIGANMFVGACATNDGENGRVRAGNFFKAPGLPASIKFMNPVASTGGNSKESIDSVCKRFVEDIETPFATITEEDYEYLIKNAPGLCIRKVKAYRDESHNQVLIAVLPFSEEKRSKLSEDYRRIISKIIEKRRLLCTKVFLVNPKYSPINVSATVYIKPQYEDKTEEIKKVIAEKIDYVNSDKQFGAPLLHQELFKEIEKLPYVSYLYDLKFAPVKGTHCKVEDQDIYPEYNGLIVPGIINVEVISHYGE